MPQISRSTNNLSLFRPPASCFRRGRVFCFPASRHLNRLAKPGGNAVAFFLSGTHSARGGRHSDHQEERMSWKTPFIKTVAEFLSHRHGITSHLLRDREAADDILADRSLVQDIFGEKGTLRPLLEDADRCRELGLDSAAAAWADPEQVLARLSPEEFQALFLKAYQRDQISSADLVEILGTPAFAESLSLEKLFSHLGITVVLDTLIEMDGLAKVVKSAVADRVNAHEKTETIIAGFLEKADPDGSHLAAYLAAHPEAVHSFSQNEEALKHFLKDGETRKRLRLLDAMERAAKIPWILPAAVVSYPRSGSNFLQSIIEHSTGMQNPSIYAAELWKRLPLLTVKSHALSPEYLEDEWERLIERKGGPERIILIKRDPRDVMISFYEYTQTQRNTAISQEEFLDQIDFFYASTIDKNYTRRVDKGPMNVAEAYRRHVREWFTERPESLDVFEASYEDMVLDPSKAFRAVLDYLAVDMPVAEQYLQVKVSIYSKEKRPRGAVHGWKDVQAEYAVLLDSVERLFSSEIETLGYAEG
jgi:LPS sulfotransferase NodH